MRLDFLGFKGPPTVCSCKGMKREDEERKLAQQLDKHGEDVY